MKLERHRPDFILFVVVILLALFGLICIYSASQMVALEESKMQSTDVYFFKQLKWVLLGLLVMLFTMNISFMRWHKLSGLMLLGSYVLLGLVFMPGIGVHVEGADRWVKFAGVQFQPSDLAMLAIIIHVAYLLSRKQDRLNDPKASYWPPIILIAIGFILIILEPDMDTAVTFALCPFVIMFAAGLPWKYIRNTIIAGLVGLIPLALMSYRGDRVATYLDPFSGDVTDSNLQIVQSMFAIATGGWTGRGLGHSIEKFSYLPQPHTDFIFAILSEEWGLIGGLVLLVLYGMLIWRGIYIAMRVPNRFASLVAIGFTTLIGFAVFLNIGSVSGLLPVIGVPLPFISYGGTSLLVKMFSMGILLNISRYTVQAPVKEDTPRTQADSNVTPLRTTRFDA
ncbi:putative lipid II flippase FtsW [Tumebacillus algifaecis]|uniref:Probable peptidoglycan glycosyltransferase FtsW n=1 Tax=Tumebacillus algifaecis TaxID=1214604 RepID=A0A223D444_9BACL|nr:putative lipid II flippase FtsW [Tumebacillus algifaecis]ASS76275.1 putative lipid II flippase FtsW [Tumebacillus algifaecis]